MKIGSEAHRESFCRYFMKTHRDYDPKMLPWSDLEEGALQRFVRSPSGRKSFIPSGESGAIEIKRRAWKRPTFLGFCGSLAYQRVEAP
jgi:hypothetical protein